MIHFNMHPDYGLPDCVRTKAIIKAQELGVNKAAKSMQLSPSSIYRWFKRMEKKSMPQIMNVICNREGKFWSSKNGWVDFDEADRFTTEERNEIGDDHLPLFNAYWATDVTTLLMEEQ